MELPNEEQNMANKVASSCVKMYLSAASNVKIAFKNMENVCTQRAIRILLFSRSKNHKTTMQWEYSFDFLFLTTGQSG